VEHFYRVKTLARIRRVDGPREISKPQSPALLRSVADFAPIKIISDP
jgi:hypothetical protein